MAWKFSKLLKPLGIIWSGLRSGRFWSVIVFFAVIIPAIVGNYFQLTDMGLNWLLALITAVPVELGGQFLSVYNGYLAYQEGLDVRNLVLLVTAVSSAITLWWYSVFWKSFARFLEGDNLSPMFIYLIGFVIFGLMMVVAVMVDMFALDQSIQRFSGITYWFENPDESRMAMDYLYNESVNHSMENRSNSTGGLP